MIYMFKNPYAKWINKHFTIEIRNFLRAYIEHRNISITVSYKYIKRDAVITKIVESPGFGLFMGYAP